MNATTGCITFLLLHLVLVWLLVHELLVYEHVFAHSVIESVPIPLSSNHELVLQFLLLLISCTDRRLPLSLSWPRLGGPLTTHMAVG